jgi:Flp pilus assembly protein TadG
MSNAMFHAFNHAMSNIMSKHFIKPLHNSRGAVAVTVAIMMTVLLAMGAAAIDIGHALVARNELQNVSDAAALAGARALGVIYQGLTPAAQKTYVLTSGDQATILSRVQTAGSANSAAGVAISINAGDVQIGLWDPATRVLTPTVNQPRDVRVIARRDGAANGPISTFLATVVGMTSVNVNAVATAELGGVGSTSPGQLDVPFGISTFYFTQFGCGDAIQFYPNDGTPQACAAWHTYNESPANANTLRNEIDGLRTGTYETPATQPGFSLNFINGNVASAFPNLINLFNAKKDANGNWDVFVPVYQNDSCSPPNGAIPIAGYATARITNVQGAPNFLISATVQCNVFDGAGGGGPSFGTFATIPGLVE